jgi:alpha-beta hydrolase superfamily lysophospholipase
MKWAKAYYTWHKRVRQYEPVSIPVTVIQGTKDNVVDWRYNIPFIKKKIQMAEIIYIKKARHQLMNEAQPFITEFLKALREQVSTE